MILADSWKSGKPKILLIEEYYIFVCCKSQIAELKFEKCLNYLNSDVAMLTAIYAEKKRREKKDRDLRKLMRPSQSAQEISVL